MNDSGAPPDDFFVLGERSETQMQILAKPYGQELLNPKDTSQEKCRTGGISRASLPLKVLKTAEKLKFDFVPNCDVWQRGDIILGCPIKPDEFDIKIWHAQLKAHHWKHARWTHAAVYIGRWEVCHATGKGIRIDDVVNDDNDFRLTDSLIRVLRLSNLAPEIGCQIALEATKQIGFAYNHDGAQLVMKHAGTNNLGSLAREPQKKYCSQLCQDAMVKALPPSGGEQRRNLEELRLIADLSLALDQVPVEWAKIHT